MKKYLLALVWFVFFVYPNTGLGTGFSTTHALSLKGAVTDAVDNSKLDEVEIILSPNSSKSITIDEYGEFTIEDFTPPEAGQPVEISFEKKGYIKELDWQIRTEYVKDIDQYTELYKLIFDGDDTVELGEYKKIKVYEPESIDSGKSEKWQYKHIKDEYQPVGELKPIDVKLYEIPAKLISGTVYYETEDGDAVPLSDASVEITKLDTVVICGDELETFEKGDETKNLKKFARFPYNYCEATGYDGKFEVWGYLPNGGEKDPYTLTIKDANNNFSETTQDIEVTNPPKEDKFQIVLKEKTPSQAREDNLEAITGFKCNELLPKYLVGANCNENKTLEGDATDLAYWIQKIGGKIAGAIGMIAVVLIVWNAFNMVTAAGDEEKISTAKKGIMWAIIGLALTMFAYIIVKTVIMLAYTQ